MDTMREKLDEMFEYLEKCWNEKKPSTTVIIGCQRRIAEMRACEAGERYTNGEK